jgi:hypothetical protein
MQKLPALYSIGFLPYFIQKAIIKGVQVLYANEVFGIIWDVDASILLEIYRKNGTTYEYQLNIRGTFKKDHSGKIIGWGSCFKIQKLFQCLKINGTVSSDGTISQSSLDALVNREVFALSYLSGTKEDGKNRYQMWDILSDSRDSLDDDFQYSNDRGYPKNYKPEMLYEENKVQATNPGSVDFDDGITDDSDDDIDSLLC